MNNTVIAVTATKDVGRDSMGTPRLQRSLR